MSRRLFLFDPPDRFVAGTVGQPGSRTFYLQARRAGQVVSVVLEKVQVAVLAERLGVLLDELEARGITPPEAPLEAAVDDQPLDEPLNETFRATTLTLGWDGDNEQILVEARAGDDEEDDDEADEDDDAEDVEAGTVIDLSAVEGLAGSQAGELLAAFEGALAEDDEDDDEGPDTLRVRLSAQDARGFVNRAMAVVAAGRLPCPLCGQPLDPQGHLCPRRNGHYVN
jgi:uncharacterized repeat protein (TIGR03847 family)